MTFWSRVRESALLRWVQTRQLRTWVVLTYLCVFAFWSGGVLLFFLFLPVYWQLWFKEDLAPRWW